MDFFLLLRIWAKILVKIKINISGKYSQKLLNHGKQSALDVLKTASEKSIQKAAEATGNLIGKKITNKITKVLRNSPQNTSETVGSETEIPKERSISQKKRQKIVNDLRLI